MNKSNIFVNLSGKQQTFSGTVDQPYLKIAWLAFWSNDYKYTVVDDEVNEGKPWQFFDLQIKPKIITSRLMPLVFPA